MIYPTLSAELTAYCSAITQALKSGIQVDTGHLRDSITVSCTLNDTSYSLTVSLLDYWKYLPDPCPLDSIFSSPGLTPPVHTSNPQSNSRFSIDFSSWSQRFSSALRTDLETFLA